MRPISKSTDINLFNDKTTVSDDVISTELPSDTAFVTSADSSMDFAPATMMSLADRLKFAMSSSRKPPTDRIQRHSKEPSFQTFPSVSISKSTDSAPSSSSLADRINTLTTDRIQEVKSTTSRAQSAPRRVTPINRDTVSTNESDGVEANRRNNNSGVMSLAELLALRNNNQGNSNNSNREHTRRRPAKINRNRFPDQITHESTATTQRTGITSPRLRLRNNLKPQNQGLDYEDEIERRIPVRRVDQLPKIKLNFPIRGVLILITLFPYLTFALIPSIVSSYSFI